MPTVRSATAEDVDAVGTALAAAFDDDPLWTWMSAPSAKRPQRTAAWFAREASILLRGHGEVLVDDDVRGAALWSPPGRWRSTGAETLRIAVPSLRLFAQRTPRAIRLINTLERVHPTDPKHWYLAILGTDPVHQGHGIGSALITAITDRCDEQGLPAYLESSKEQNVPFYRRHGFEVTEELTIAGGPPVWLMFANPTDEQRPMIEPKQIQRATETFVVEVSVGIRDVVKRLPAVDGRNLDADVATEAFNLVTALIDVDRSHTDNELWGLIFAFGSWMPGQLGRAKPDQLRQSNLLVGRAAWLDQVSPMFEVLVTADRKFGTAHSRSYYDRALHLAFTVAALEAAPSRAELQAIDGLRSQMLAAMEGLAGSPLTPGPAPPAVTAAGPAAPTGSIDTASADATEEELPPARPIEELLAELDELVGLESVKTEVRLVTNLLRVQQLRDERNLPTSPQSRHLVFTGNPGTGKTTVARLLAGIYRSLGVVEKGQLIETDRSGLVSGFVGQTALKVVEVADRAVGGVLLVDEAYALARGGENDFGREAIDTLVKVIEDRRDDLVVIAAGYPDEMATFIAANPGLASRFPKTIFFPDYSEDELWRIFSSIGEKAGYRPDGDAEAKVRAWFTSVPHDKGFGNGRLARNLFEDAVARQAGRVVEITDPTDEQLAALTGADIASPGEGPRHGNTG